MPKKGYKQTKEHSLKIHSEKWKEKMREAGKRNSTGIVNGIKTRFKKGHPQYNTGRTWLKKGENAWNWKGGISFDRNKYEKERRKNQLQKIAGRKISKQCEICGSFGKICFDHNHETGKFRGWICSRCNTTIGLVEDNIELLNKLIKYLKCQK